MRRQKRNDSNGTERILDKETKESSCGAYTIHTIYMLCICMCAAHKVQKHGSLPQLSVAATPSSIELVSTTTEQLWQAGSSSKKGHFACGPVVHPISKICYCFCTMPYFLLFLCFASSQLLCAAAGRATCFICAYFSTISLCLHLLFNGNDCATVYMYECVYVCVHLIVLEYCLHSRETHCQCRAAGVFMLWHVQQP